MSVRAVFDAYRKKHPVPNSWALAWFLAHEFCSRFYASHGIAPCVIEREGLGYCGLQLKYLHCPVNGDDPPIIGRITALGDVEDWITGGPGDHALQLNRLYRAKVPTDQLVEQAVRFFRLPAIPEKTHIGCRHKRWGDSYNLVFEIAAILAIRRVCEFIWNDPYHTRQVIDKIDPQAGMKQHPGAFLFGFYEPRVVIAGDGRVLCGGVGNLWERYVRGETALSLASQVESWLGTE